MSKYKIIIDTREQVPWKWNASARCDGTITQKLTIADYSLVGFEEIFLIEKKRSPLEIHGNIIGGDADRFHRELEKLNKIKHAWLIFEFTVQDVLGFPFNQNIPKNVKYKIRCKGDELLYRINKLYLDYPNIHIVFAGNKAREFATSLFKRMSSIYPELLIND